MIARASAGLERQVKIYEQVVELAQKHQVTEVYDELEAYAKHVEEYKKYAENPTEYIRDHGYAVYQPLSPERRIFLKKRGFTFHSDNTVKWSPRHLI